MTERVENDNITIETTSDLSEWAGPEMINPLIPLRPARDPRPTVEPDVFDWTNRLIEITAPYPDGIPMSSSESQTYYHFPLVATLKLVDIFKDLLSKYYGFSYESITITLTASDPKGLVGGMMVGWWPYIDYFDKGPSQSMDAWKTDPLLMTGMYNNPNTQLITFGASQDITMTVPWTFKFPFYLTKWVAEETLDTQNGRPPHGAPILWMDILRSFYVSGVTMPARIRIFAKFNGLKFYGPMRNASDLQAQSGAGAIAMAAVNAAAAAGATIVTDTLIDKFKALGGKSVTTGESGTDNFDRPQAVQMAYLGDTTSTGTPLVDPIFIPPTGQGGADLPTIHDMLKRPQYIATYDTYRTDPVVLSNNPTGFGLNARSNYFQYFAMINRYWRGTLVLHVIVAGHPFVEVAVKAKVYYPGSTTVARQEFVEFAVHRSVFNGTKHLKIPIPYLTPNDYRPIVDKPGASSSTTTVSLDVKVVSTMLDVAPTIPYYLFMSAGDDFAFYQPYPPGLYNVHEYANAGKLAPPDIHVVDDLVAQVGLPSTGQEEVANTRFAFTTDPGTLTSMNTLYDYMRIWSRCIPFKDYDNDGDEEPIPDAIPGFSSASWYPPIDRSADIGANNSWYFTLDYVAYLSSLFCFYRGGMGFKVIAASKNRPQEGYLYVSLGDSNVANRQRAHCPFPYDDAEIPPNANLGAGSVVTPIVHQPVLETTLPYRGVNIWSNVIWSAAKRGVARNDDAYNASVQTNIVLQNTGNDVLTDVMFRKAGVDFDLAVEAGLPPPTMWIARGGDW